MGHYSVIFKCVVFLIAIFLLCGCATMGLLNFDKAANQNIKKIALLRVKEPPLDLAGDVSSLAGVIQFAGTGTGWAAGAGGVTEALTTTVPSTAAKVGMVAGGMAASLIIYYTIEKPTREKAREIALKAKDENFVFFSPAMVEALRRELTKVGYDFIYLKDHSWLKDVEKDIEPDADAFLWVYTNTSYDYHKKSVRPRVFVTVRLYESSSKKAIYSRNYDVSSWGSRASSPNVTFMRPDEKYKFDSFIEMLKNFDEAA